MKSKTLPSAQARARLEDEVARVRVTLELRVHDLAHGNVAAIPGDEAKRLLDERIDTLRGRARRLKPRHNRAMRLRPSTIWLLAASAALAIPMAAERLTGQVIDDEGNPVPGTEIRHTGDRYHAHASGDQGQFSLETSAPKVVIGKAGFRSQLVSVPGGGIRKIVLKRLAPSDVLPSCEGAGPFASLEGWRDRFAFRVVPGMTWSARTTDVDYAVRSYSVRKHHSVRQGAGALWGPGWPSDQDVWQSVRLEEIRFMAGGEVTFARGELANGNQWRYLGVFGESAQYSGVDRTTARALDEVMDGACLLAQPPPPR